MGVGRLLLLKPLSEYPTNLIDQLPGRMEYGQIAFSHSGQMSKVANSKSPQDMRERMAGAEKQGASKQNADWPADLYGEAGEYQPKPQSQPVPVSAAPLAKYSGVGMVKESIFQSLDIPLELRGGVLAAANFGLSGNTHGTYLTAIKKYRVCLAKYGLTEEWPVSRGNLISFVGWALNVEQLQPSTVRTYLASLSKYSALVAGEPLQSDPLVQMMLKGATNSLVSKKKKAKVVMTVAAMAILHEKIFSSKHNGATKKLLWAVSTVAFCGCHRLGELLMTKAGDGGGVRVGDLKRMKMTVDGVSHEMYSYVIRSPKEKRGEGDVEIELIGGMISGVDPVAALDSYLTEVKGKGVTEPLFAFREGNPLLKSQFNKLLRGILKGVEGYEDLGNHSFR